MNHQKIKFKLEKTLEKKNVEAAMTLNYITNLAMRTSDHESFSKEVRRILGVGESESQLCRVGRHTYEYLPADNKL